MKTLLKEYPDLFSFSKNHAVFANGNTMLFISKDCVWKNKFSTTFYRDPYTDVKISAINTNEKYVAVGTNFMDGKLYIFTDKGKKLWEQQFATIASLGWRPEDVTNVSIGKDVVAVTTQFMHDYVYVFTLDRYRLFERRFDEDIINVFAGENIVVTTEDRVFVFNRQGKLILEDEGKVNCVFEHSGKLVFCGDVKNSKNSIYCDFAGECGNYIYAVDGNMLKILDEKFGELWSFEASSNIVKVMCDNSKIYVMCDGEIFIFWKDKLIWNAEFQGRAIGICRIGAFYYNNGLNIMPFEKCLSTN